MINSNFIERWQQKKLKKALNSRRVLILAGPRQCGKTTLARRLAEKDVIYYTLDDQMLLDSAINDPKGFIKHGDELMIIDEIQKAPNLLNAIKLDVDQNQSYGRYLLTGSSNLKAIPEVNESLAGRVKTIRLRSLVMGELYGNEPTFIENAFNEIFKTHKDTENYEKDDYLKLAIKGGYPEVRGFELTRDVLDWHLDYMQTLMQKNIKDILSIRNIGAMKQLVGVLCAWSSKLMDVSAIGSSLAITRGTLESYINAIKAMYLIDSLPAWIKTDYEWVAKKDKLYLTDTGLMASTLKWTFEKIRLDGDRNGKLIETFVYNQLKPQLEASNEQRYEMFHYRDREKREIDFLIENEAGDILGIEVKSGTSINSKAFKHLKWFKENIANEKKFIGIVLYSGNKVIKFKDSMWAIPINSLWA